MLYISTRNESETYTAHVALTRTFAADGGNIIPFRLPEFTYDAVRDLKNKPYNQIMADILNQFFSARLTLWDMDLCVGKSNVRTLTMSHRLMVAELWHNPVGDFKYIVERLRNRLAPEATESTPWLKTAVWIASFFAIYGQLLSDGILEESSEFDVVVSGDDLLMPVAAHYARRMGLPVNTVICSCSGESNLWDLVRRGSISTSFNTAALSGIEGLVHAVLGARATGCFLSACEKRGIYNVDPLQLPAFTDGFYCTVAGEKRADATINSLFRSNRYVIDPSAAIYYSGLQDYRSGTGSSRMTLLISEHTPMDFADQICNATGIAKNKLFEHVKL